LRMVESFFAFCFPRLLILSAFYPTLNSKLER
jgi:hypothetical protein